MLAGCSSTLLSSPRHRLRSESSLQFQPCHLQVQEKLHQHHQSSQQKMGTQRFDLSCSFPRREAPRITVSVENSIEGRSNLSFRQNPVTPTSLSSSLVAKTVPWEAKSEIEGCQQWGKNPRKNLKRLYDQHLHSDETDDDSDSYIGRSKRTKFNNSISTNQLADGDDIWFPRNVQEPATDLETTAFGQGLPDFSDKDFFGSSTSGIVKQQQQRSSSSTPETHCSSVNPNEDEYSENETGDGSGSLGVTVGEDKGSNTEQQGQELMTLLMACLESVGSGNLPATNYFLARLGELASPVGTTIHRVVAYFTEALVLRVARLWPHAFFVFPPSRLVTGNVEDNDDAMAVRLLNHISPIPKFIHFTMNEMILRAFEGKDRVHIIDFDIKQGLQWPSLFQSLASRPDPPTHLRITGIGDSKQELQDTGVRLAGFAEALNLPFEFHAVVDRFEDVRFWMLHVKEGECVAVNCIMQLHKALYDDTGCIVMNFLSLIRSTNPAVLVVAEQEADHNNPRWEMRLASSLPYYSAIFDSVEACLPLSSPARIKIEEMFAREIRSIIACEGTERVSRHWSFTKWKELMEIRGGFRSMGVTQREMLQSRMPQLVGSASVHGVSLGTNTTTHGQRSSSSNLSLGRPIRLIDNRDYSSVHGTEDSFYFYIQQSSLTTANRNSFLHYRQQHWLTFFHSLITQIHDTVRLGIQDMNTANRFICTLH